MPAERLIDDSSENGNDGHYRLSRIKIPAIMPSTANAVLTVEEILMLSKGNNPVRINQRPSKSIPRFLPTILFVNAMPYPPS